MTHDKELEGFLRDKEIKSIAVDFKNKDGRLNLFLTGKNSVENALKVMKSFDEGCREGREG